MSWPWVKHFLSVPHNDSDKCIWFVWQTLPSLTRISEDCLSSSCLHPLFFPLCIFLLQGLYSHYLSPSLGLRTLLISPQALIFVPHFISFTLSLSHLSLYLSTVVILSARPGQFPWVQSVQCWEVGGRSERLFPLHFTQGLEMRQTQLQTDEAPLRASVSVCVCGTDHFSVAIRGTC